MQKSGFDLPRANWRLIITPPGRGPWNMAIDEAILEAAGRELVPPTLRLYAWSPPCLSIGFSQPAADVDLKALHSLGWDIVRRPTGGARSSIPMSSPILYAGQTQNLAWQAASWKATGVSLQPCWMLCTGWKYRQRHNPS
jgi:hypothetical protein